jgi:hypothetical protein
MRRRLINKKAILGPLIVVCASIGLTIPGCSQLLINYHGAKIRQGYEIQLVKGQKTVGHYTTLDLTVDYQYEVKDETLQIAGKVRFADYLRREYGLRYFNLSLLFADKENNIIENRSLTSAGYGGPVTFDRTLKLPAKTKAMVFAFTYTGHAMGGGEGGGPWDFWSYPIVQ